MYIQKKTLIDLSVSGRESSKKVHNAQSCKAAQEKETWMIKLQLLTWLTVHVVCWSSPSPSPSSSPFPFDQCLYFWVLQLYTVYFLVIWCCLHVRHCHLVSFVCPVSDWPSKFMQYFCCLLPIFLGLALKLPVCNNGQSSLKTHMPDKRRRSATTYTTQI